MKTELAALLDAKIPLTDYTGRSWYLFISAYNESERVKSVFSLVPASQRSWWIIPEYGYKADELNMLNNYNVILGDNEATVVQQGLSASGFRTDMRVCIDITGLMRPQVLYLMAHFKIIGVKEFHLLYTEPEHYSRRAETRFSIGEDVNVRSVIGFIGAHDADTSGDVLILGIGYDHHLMSHVIQAKESARLLELHSFPSLSADMYHESILRFDRIYTRQNSSGEIYYTSANDPCVVSLSIENAIASARMHKKITNIYLSPTATKPQAVGFGIYYLRHCLDTAASIIYPNSQKYDRETSKGVGRSWIYPIVY